MKPLLKLSLFVLLLCSLNAYADVEFEHEIADQEGPKNPWVKLVGDINNDGLLDIVIGGRGGPVVWYAYPDWQKTHISDGGYSTVDGAVGDIDNDGDNDVVIGAEYWYENPLPDGDPSKDQWETHPIKDLRTHDIEIGDLDADGDLDIVARDQSGFGHKSGNKIHFFQQENPDQWTYHVIDCPHGEGLLLGDIDQDGDEDVLAGKKWFENSGKIVEGEWKVHTIVTDWHQDTSVAMGDINGDQNPDIVLTRSEGPYRISWFEAPENSKQENWKEHLIENPFDYGHGVQVGDMDLDGDLDVISAEMHQSDSDRVLVFYNQQNGESWETQLLTKTGLHNLVVCDFGDDGDMDIMGANWSGNYQPIEVWINQIRK